MGTLSPLDQPAGSGIAAGVLTVLVGDNNLNSCTLGGVVCSRKTSHH
jgi:hypothetical protein